MTYTQKRSQLVKQQCLLVFTFLVVLLTTNAQNKVWKIDPAHSNIEFSISYFKVGEIKGTFDDYEGTFISNGNAMTSSTITIRTASINTNQVKRDEHLRSDDFFGAKKYSEIKFESTSFNKITDKEYELKETSQ